MPFRYQMQKVLQLMELQEKQCDAEVLARTRERNAEQDLLNELQQRKAASQKGLQAQMSAGATPDVAASNDYIQHLNLKMAAQEKRLALAQGKLDAATELQHEARRNRKKMEAHRDKAKEAWALDEKKAEAKRTDEMAGTIFMKKRGLAAEEELEAAERLAKLEALRKLRALREGR